MYATVVTANRARFPKPGAVISASANLRRGPVAREELCPLLPARTHVRLDRRRAFSRLPLNLAMKGLMSIDLGLPTLPAPTLAPRRKSRQIKVGKVAVGGDAPISVQSMTTTLTADVNA